MKLFRYLLLLVMFSVPIMACATAQEPEKITINGEEWDMMTLPIEQDSILNEKVAKLVHIPDLIISTGNYREYTGYWELKDNNLFLRGIKRRDGNYIEIDTLKKNLLHTVQTKG